FGLHKILPQLVTAQALATLCAMAPVSRFAELARQRAIDFLLSGQPGARDLDRFGFNPMALHAWMRCSYSDHPRKHEIKGLLGDMLAGMTGAPDFQLTTPVQVEGKPVLLVPLELFVRDHAMYRCYAHAIAGAREHFHTVGVGISG